MSEPNDDWPCKFDESPELEKSRINFSCQTINKAADIPEESCNGDKDFTFPSGPSVAEDDDEVTETKIKAFLDEKVLLLARFISLKKENDEIFILRYLQGKNLMHLTFSVNWFRL